MSMAIPRLTPAPPPRFSFEALRSLSGVALATLLALGSPVAGAQTSVQPGTPVSISLPGPGSTVSLPLEIAVKIGADRAEGLQVRPRYIPGGGVALRELQSGNADFGMFGLPAAMLMHLTDPRIVTLAAVDDLPLYVLMVRSDLRPKVARIEDLKGRTIGIHANSLNAKTTSHQLVDLLLQGAQVGPDAVRIVAAGANWETMSATLRSASADAVLTDEPFATRLEQSGIAFRLFSTDRPEDARRIAGAGFLRVALHARRDRVDANPELAEKVVRMIQRTLAWIAQHSPEQVADALQLPDPAAREALVAVLRNNPRQYSRDGKFSAAQLRDTEIFFRATNTDTPAAQRFSVDTMIMDRWAGRKP